MSTSFLAMAGFLSALAVARASQTVAPAEPAPCGASPTSMSREDADLFDDIAPSRIDWYDALPVCARSTRARAKTSLAMPANGKVASGGRVTVRGHLAIGSAPTNPIEFLDDDGQPSACQPSPWRWELVLCGGERLEIQFREKLAPSHFVGSGCGGPYLTKSWRDVVVWGRLGKKEEIERVPPRIDDAKICRP